MSTNRLKKEIDAFKTMNRGYNRRAAVRWYKAKNKDIKDNSDKYDISLIKKAHSLGYLSNKIEGYGIFEGQCDYITDLDYIFAQPINSSFTKWIANNNTLERVLTGHESCLLKNYYSVVYRDGSVLVTEFPFARNKCDSQTLVDFLKANSNKKYQFRPAYWKTTMKKYVVSHIEGDNFEVNGEAAGAEYLHTIFNSVKNNYLLCEHVEIGEKPVIKLYICNSFEGKEKISCASVIHKETGKHIKVELNDGTYVVDGQTLTVDNWDNICEKMVDMCSVIEQLDFFAISIVPVDGGFKVIDCKSTPDLPDYKFPEKLNLYLKDLVAKKKLVRQPFKKKVDVLMLKVKNKLIRMFCRKGVRPYMQKLWFSAVKDDFTFKGTTLRQKIWAWKRGYLSYRIEQYGLTEENYKNFLSDYDYHWLNRINNVYQGWINDKTTYRYIMEPLKEFVPKYYFSVCKKNGKAVLVRMSDCPAEVETSYEGVFEILKQEEKLVFKPSAGTHGDGFYCFEYDGDNFLANGEVKTKEEIVALIEEQKSFYVITEYINMHPELKKIYPKSVNSIRVMVINREGYNPEIMQAYMRIGSSKTGYTDNVGYGGICAMIDLETGVLYNPESIKDHHFYPCEAHPDTGVEISGIHIPEWKKICDSIKEISILMPELEYLGFDVAVTDGGFQVMEINIHQDLHKAGLHTEEIKQFYRDKIAEKKKVNNIK